MSRTIVSLAVMVALLVLTAAGPCLACSLPNQNTPAQGSCCHHGGCEKPAKTPAPQSCASPDLGVLTIERPWTQVVHAAADVLSPETVAHSAPAISHRNALLPLVDAYSPPDLCLLNSVFNI